MGFLGYKSVLFMFGSYEIRISMNSSTVAMSVFLLSRFEVHSCAPKARICFFKVWTS